MITEVPELPPTPAPLPPLPVLGENPGVQAAPHFPHVSYRIQYDAGQQPVVVAPVPDLVELPRGYGRPLLILPQRMQLWGKEGERDRMESQPRALHRLRGLDWGLTHQVLRRTQARIEARIMNNQ